MKVYGGAFDEKTIFEYQGKFYMNKESVVKVAGGYEFRNPPKFMPTRDEAKPRRLLFACLSCYAFVKS